MHQLQAQLNALQRPKLLILAARVAITEFQCGQDLQMVNGGENRRNPQQIFDTLMAEEHRLNAERVEGNAAYNVRKHIRTLTALMVVTSSPLLRQQTAA